MYGSSTPCSLKAAHMLLCPTVSEGSLQVDGCDPQRMVPLGGSLSELPERVKVVCRGVARSETCLVIGLVVVLCGLLSFEDKLAEEFV